VKRLAALAAVALLLAGCGSETQAQAVRGWLSNASFTANSTTLTADVAHARTALDDASASAAELHTVCGILSTDTAAAGASLPTPTNATSVTLNTAYTEFANAGAACYVAAGRPHVAALALGELTAGSVQLVDATLQLHVAASLITPATAMRAWSSYTNAEVNLNVVYRAAHGAALDLGFSPRRLAQARTSCRIGQRALSEVWVDLPSPDGQSTTQLTTTQTELSPAFTSCLEPHVTAGVAGQLRTGAATAYFALQRMEIVQGGA
jgi:hypothetical protein